MKTVIVDLRDGDSNERYDVRSYWYEDGGLVLELCEDDRVMGTVRYAPGAVVSVTEWAEDEDEDDGDEEAPAPAFISTEFTVGDKTVVVRQNVGRWGVEDSIDLMCNGYFLCTLTVNGLRRYVSCGPDFPREMRTYGRIFLLDEPEREAKAAPQAFKVGKATVQVTQCDDGIKITDAANFWSLVQLRSDGLHLYQAIGDDAGFELESHDDVGGYLKTRWN